MKDKFLKLSKKLSLFQTKLMLVLVYVFALSPIALIWKLIRKDPLNKSWKKSENSYMITYEESEILISNLEKPY